jgi:hypothetical protein
MLRSPFLASGWFSLFFLNHGHLSVVCFPSHLSHVADAPPFFSKDVAGFLGGASVAVEGDGDGTERRRNCFEDVREGW